MRLSIMFSYHVIFSYSCYIVDHVLFCCTNILQCTYFQCLELVYSKAVYTRQKFNENIVNTFHLFKCTSERK